MWNPGIPRRLKPGRPLLLLPRQGLIRRCHMSSVTPTVTPPPRHRVVRRSLAGPIVLIVLGVVFLLGNIGYLTWPSIGRLFARYWPVLIIIWGLVKLLEHFRARREGYAAPGIGGGGIFLLIVLVIAGLSATQAERVNWNQVAREMDIEPNFDGMFSFGSPHDFSDEIQQEFPNDGALRVTSDRGDVTVLAWDQKNIKVSIQKRVMTESDSDAQQVNESTKPKITIADKIVSLNANTAAAGRHRVDTNMEIYIPRNAAVEITDGHGKLIVRDRSGDLKLSTAHGDVDVSNVQGNVNINMRKGNVQAENVSGDVTISGTGNDISVSNIRGALQLTGEYFGDIALSHIAKTVRFNSAKTDMELAKLDGDLAMESGDLHVTNFNGPSHILTHSKDIHLEDVAGDVKIQNTNGDVEVDAHKLPLGNISVDNRKGDVKLVLPPNGGFRVDGRTNRGDISSDFDELKVNSSEPESSISGSVGNGSAQVRVNTEHADIEIRKS